jgi:HlyD family secretion protein
MQRSTRNEWRFMTTTRKSNFLLRTSSKRVAIIIVLAILIGAGGYAYLRLTSSKTTSVTTGSSLQTTKATTGDLILFASGSGTVSPAAESNFGFNSSGQVSEINVKVGDHVEAGQVLAQLDDTQAKINLAQAQAAMDKLTSAIAIATAKQTLASAQSNLVTAKQALQYLVSPQVLYWEEKIAEREPILAEAKSASQTDTSDAAKQKVAQAEASLKYAQNSLIYSQKVYKSEYIPATFTQYRTTKTPRGTRTELVKIVDETTGEKTALIYPPTEGEIGIARANYEAAKGSVTEAQAYLDTLTGTDIPKGATGANLVTYIKTKHALETAEYNLNATKLIAPISGTVTTLDINVGDLATNGNSVATISNLAQPYSLDAYLDAEDWGQIQVRYEVDVTFDIVPGQVFKGKVTAVYPTLDTTSSNSALVHFTASLNDSISYQLPSGSATSVEVIGGSARNAVLVPIEALHEFGDGKYALFVMKNDKLQLRVVEVGLQDLTKAEIISGLSAGETVTTGVVKTK